VPVPDHEALPQPAPDSAPPSDSATHRGEPAIQYVRKFNLPTGLQRHDRICLLITEWSGRLVSARLNDERIPVASSPLEADITALLKPHNHLALQLTAQGGHPPCLCGEVSLRIDEQGES
jgi:hypothetical protein